MTDGKLHSGQSLHPEQTLVSVGGHAHLHYQSDGNLVVYLDDVPFWASHTDGHSAGRLWMRPDGNLVLSDATQDIAATQTQGHPGAMVQLQDDGNFVVYENPRGPLAGTPLWASATGIFGPPVAPYEPVTPVGEILPPLQGDIVRVNNGRGGIADATGRRLSVNAHAGDFVARVINDPNGKTTTAQNLDYSVGEGVHALRVWFFLPSTWWATPPRPGNATPTDPRWEPAVRWLLEEMRKRGLYLQADGGDLLQFNQADRVRYAERWGRLVRESGVGLFSVGVANEGWQNGESYEATPESVQRMAECLTAFEHGYGRRVGLSTLTSVRDEGLLNDYVRGTNVPTVISYHGTRGPYRHACERAWTTAYADYANATEPKLRDYELDDEPAGVNSQDGPIGSGPGTHVSATNPSDMVIWRELEAYGTYMAAHYIGRQTPTILTSTGIISDEPFSVYPHYAHVARIAALLPKDVQGWKHFHGGDNRDFSPLRVLAAPEHPGTWRCEHALNEATGEIVVVTYGNAPGTYRMPVISGFEGVIITPDASLARQPLTLTAGQPFDVDMRYGRILIGHRR